MNLRAIAESLPAAFRASLEVALILVLSVQAARLVWIVAEPPGPFGSPVATAPSAADDHFAVLKSVNPFAPRESAASIAADTSGLLLHGVRVGSRGTGSAIISSDGKQALYWIGDEIASGAVLEDVASDHVILAHGETTSRLELAVRASAPNQTGAVPPYMFAPRPAAAPATAPVSAIDTKKLIAEAGLRPRTEGGRVTGYTLLPRGEGEMLSRAGLAPGDVLVALNGNRITPERYSELEQELTGASQVQLTVERGNETRTVTLRTRE
jgi:general secretion pathway protein C